MSGDGGDAWICVEGGVGMCRDDGDAWICVEVVWGCVEMVEMHGYVWRWCGDVSRGWRCVDMCGGGVGMCIEPFGTPHFNQHLSGKFINVIYDFVIILT